MKFSERVQRTERQCSAQSNRLTIVKNNYLSKGARGSTNNTSALNCGAHSNNIYDARFIDSGLRLNVNA